MTENKSESQIRLEKYQELKKSGVEVFPSDTPEHIALSQAKKLSEGKKVAIVGRIVGLRTHGKIAFLDLFEDEEKIQVFVDAQQPFFETIKLLDSGDYLYVKGQLFLTKAGELTVKAQKLQLLAKALLPIPESWQGLSDIETRYRQRALDFKVNPVAREIIKKRSHVIRLMRAFLDNLDFIEIQTPILQAIPGGASAKPFITRYNTLEADFYLRIAPELYLKRLITGGFERVYEIGPSFRNEGLSHMHNPEFTTCEFYWAYQNYLGLMTVSQKMVQELVKKVTGSLKISYQKQEVDFSGDFTVERYSELIEKETGLNIDRLDTFAKLKTAVKEKKITFENQDIKVWSELVDELFKKVVRPKIVQPTFVIDYPISTTPLAKTKTDNPQYAQRFQLILAGGFELINAYSELNDPIEQEERFREQMKMKKEGWAEAQVLDENYIEALKYGMPPTAGWGLGIDRLVMILTDQYSIKEVIPFPTLRPINGKKGL